MKHGIHYLDEDNTLYYNAEIEGSEWVDEFAAATIARDAAAAEGQTAAQQKAAYDAELTKQQGINAQIFAQPPRWVLIKRRALNDTRMEDSLLQYIDKKHTQVDWYYHYHPTKNRQQNRLHKRPLPKSITQIYQLF
jgi:hypothetical protein